jgi:hypothetical protein
MRNFDNYCPVSADTYAYLDREDQEPETERARCETCGVFFSRPVGVIVTVKRCPTHERARWEALVARSPLLQRVEGGRAAHIALGRIA